MLRSNPPEVECGGAKVRLGDFLEAWEATEPEHGVYLRSAPWSPLRGAVMFYPNPHASALRAALGNQIKPASKGV